MTLAEFKAWLDGFLDGKDGLTAEQVATVRAKLAGACEPMPSSPAIAAPWLPTYPYGPATSFGSSTFPHDPNQTLQN